MVVEANRFDIQIFTTLLGLGGGQKNLSLFISASYPLKIKAGSITSNDLIGIISEPYLDWVEGRGQN